MPLIIAWQFAEQLSAEKGLIGDNTFLENG
jgi:hypothetical protein